jgi:alpha-1,2-mannosyltransferase
VACVRLRCRGAVLAKAYPVATLLGQALGSVLLAAEALLRLTPELFIDTAVRAASALRVVVCSLLSLL